MRGIILLLKMECMTQNMKDVEIRYSRKEV